MAKNDVTDYEFELLSEDMFEIRIFLHTTNAMFKDIFKKSVKALGKRKVCQIDPESKMPDIEQVEIEHKYYPLIKRYLGKQITDIERDCMRIEKVKYLDWTIVKIVSQKKPDGNWIMTITIKGTYVGL